MCASSGEPAALQWQCCPALWCSVGGAGQQAIHLCWLPATASPSCQGCLPCPGKLSCSPPTCRCSQNVKFLPTQTDLGCPGKAGCCVKNSQILTSAVLVVPDRASAVLGMASLKVQPLISRSRLGPKISFLPRAPGTCAALWPSCNSCLIFLHNSKVRLYKRHPVCLWEW